MKKELSIVNNQEILGKEFTIYGTKEEPLFLAKDVAEMIEHSKPRNMVSEVDEDEKVKMPFKIASSRSTQEQWFLTEGGLYEVLMQSRKPIAKTFKKEVKIILKSIRLNGGYISEDATLKQREELINNTCYSQRVITKMVNGADIMELQKVVEHIIEINCNVKKKDRKDKQLQKYDVTEYKQLLREHIRKAIEKRGYGSDIANHSLEIAIRGKLIIGLLDDRIETTNRSWSHRKAN